MVYTGIINDFVIKAKKNKKTIVLPESSDLRVLNAAADCIKDDIANIILIGNKENIVNLCKYNNILLDFKKVKIVDPLNFDKFEDYAQHLYDLRKHKGMTIENARKILKDNVYFGVMMVKLGDGDGLVSGAIHATSDTLRPALQIIKQADGINSVSSFFLMDTPKKNLGFNGKFIFSDCGLIEFPTKEQLIDITKASAKSFIQFIDKNPKVALLSYSTKGSAKSEEVDKTAEVANILIGNVDFEVDGELQLDAAIISDVAKLKAPLSNVAGHANVLIFPDIQSGNIGYKLVQRFSDAIALGPITQGLAKPVNDLSRGCSIEEIVGVVAITCVQAQAVNK